MIQNLKNASDLYLKADVSLRSQNWLMNIGSIHLNKIKYYWVNLQRFQLSESGCLLCCLYSGSKVHLFFKGWDQWSSKYRSLLSSEKLPLKALQSTYSKELPQNIGHPLHAGFSDNVTMKEEWMRMHLFKETDLSNFDLQFTCFPWNERHISKKGF